jgi:hypothetical protein
MRRLLASLAVVVAVALLAWNAGETHRQNCLEQHRTGCTILPWDQGSYPRPTTGRALDPVGRAELRNACRQLAIDC